MTEHLVKEIARLGIPAVAESTATPVTGPSLAHEGYSLSVDEGKRMRRMVVGFGAGASEVRTFVQVYEITPEGRRLVEDFYTTVKRARKPGMGPMVGVGAAASVVASAVVSGSVGLATAHGQTLRPTPSTRPRRSHRSSRNSSPSRAGSRRRERTPERLSP